METKNVVIVEGCRTAVGSMGGALKPVKAVDLACTVIKGLLDRTHIDGNEVDEVILGQCRQSSDESNAARVASLRAGLPIKVSAQTVMRQCASAMTAVQTGAMQIALGVSDVVIAGGTESMSNGIFYVSNARWGVGTGTTEFKDAVTEGQFMSQPNEIFGRFNMGMTAENIAREMNISREDQDMLAYNSHMRATAAIREGRFKDEIVPVVVPQGKKKDPIIFDTDEFVRPETTLEKLAKLKPVFAKDEKATVTAGNSSGRNDGAAAVLMMSEEKAKELGLKPICKIIGMGNAGCDPRTMGYGPVHAVPKALANAGLKMEDIQLIELNEAFAAQALGCIRSLGWEDKMDIINVNGSGISLGHPIGCTGCRILVTLMYEMRRRGLKYGLATLCVGGGMGGATVIEMCD